MTPTGPQLVFQGPASSSAYEEPLTPTESTQDEALLLYLAAEVPTSDPLSIDSEYVEEHESEQEQAESELDLLQTR